MTILTLPSFAGAVKSDKAHLLVDQPTLSYRPERLEGGTSDEDQVGDGGWTFKIATIRLAFVAFVLACLLAFVAFVLAGDMLCRSYKKNFAHSMVQKGLWYTTARPEDDGAPCKSYYTSYAAVKNDMSLLSPVVSDSGADYDGGGGGNNNNNNNNNNDDDDEHGKLVDDTGRRSSSVPATGPDDTVSPNLITITDAARFIHDFSVNVTGIVDVPAKRCFVMPLLRQSVAPPKSLFDLMFKMSSGYYSTDIKKVMANMRVVEPPVKDLSGYGLYISKDCAAYATYALSVNTARL